MILRNYYYADIGYNTLLWDISEPADALDGRLHLLRAINGELIPTISGYGESQGGETEIGYNSNPLSSDLKKYAKVEKSELLCDTSYRTKSVSPSYGVYFSSGTTQPTINDYTPSGEIFTTYEATYTQTFSYDEDGCERVMNYTLTNTGTEDFTIGEVGLLTYAYQKYSGTRYYYYHILIERTVLETPITIPAGGVGQVTYRLRLNIPVA